MALVNVQDMLHHAYACRYAVPAFSLVNLEFLAGVIEAAEQLQAPILLSLNEPDLGARTLEQLLPAVRKAAEQTSVPVGINLERTQSLASAVRAIRDGCNCITFDASARALLHNIEHTRPVAEMCHACGITVGGTLGDLSRLRDEAAVALDVSGDASSWRGRIDTYAERAGVDFVSVKADTLAEGSGHASKTKIDPRIKAPRLLHAETALSAEALPRLTGHGVTSIRIDSSLVAAAEHSLRQRGGKGLGDAYLRLMGDVRTAIREEAARCMQLSGSTDQAHDVLTQCRPWREVEHLIIYNVADLSEAGVLSMMDEGRRALTHIPGVRSVFTGQSVENGKAFPYCWLIRFCNPAVIESYAAHPQHVAFADNLFRPHAKERISIDYKEVQ
jgi:fructose-bisphosphate aldolase class II